MDRFLQLASKHLYVSDGSNQNLGVLVAFQCSGRWASKNDRISLHKELWLSSCGYHSCLPGILADSWIVLRKLVSDCSEPPQLETFSSKGTSSMTIVLNLANKRWACSTWSPPTSWQWILKRGEGERERTIVSLSASHGLALLQNVSSWRIQ